MEHKVLISAYACEPGKGSEGEIGWSLVHELAKYNQIWVITRANNKEVHDKAYTQKEKPDSLHFIYYDTPKWARWYKKGKRFFLIYYYLWQIGTIFKARRFLKRNHIDLTHHLTGGMDWMPSGLAFLNLPFLWGPVGSEKIPTNILRTLPKRVRFKELLRKMVLFYGRNLDPLTRLTGRKATIILSHTPGHLPHRYQSKITYQTQTGIHSNPHFACMRKTLNRSTIFTVIFAGELIHWKGAAYAVQAFLDFAKDKKDVRLIMIGDGPLRKQLQKTVIKSKAHLQVRFEGKVSMSNLKKQLTKGDVFLYPSYHHGLATVVLQAMLTGMPVVCLEGDAIGRAIKSTCGITVPINNNNHISTKLSAALFQLYDNEPLRLKLAKESQTTAQNTYAYEAIGRTYKKFYNQLLSHNVNSVIN